MSNNCLIMSWLSIIRIISSASCIADALSNEMNVVPLSRSHLLVKLNSLVGLRFRYLVKYLPIWLSLFNIGSNYGLDLVCGDT